MYLARNKLYLTHSMVSLSRNSFLDFAELTEINVVTLVLINHLEGYFKLPCGL